MIQDKSLTFSSQIDNSKGEILGHILYSKSKNMTLLVNFMRFQIKIMTIKVTSWNLKVKIVR